MLKPNIGSLALLGIAAVGLLWGLSGCNPRSRTHPILGFSPYVDQTIPRTGGQFKITVRSNLSWTAELQAVEGEVVIDDFSWCRLSRTTGSGADSVIVVIDPNPEQGPLRRVNLVFRDAEGQVPEKGFTITQKEWVDPTFDLFNAMPDSALRVYCKQFDKDGDGILSLEEAEAVREINVTGYEDIKSLEGITGFSGLTSLRCAQTGIDTLWVVGLSELETLDYSNTAVRHAPDVSSCPKLVTLNCSHTAITALDVTKNPALANLRCNNTAITALDVTHCPDLGEIWCAHTQLSALDISLNEYLTRLEADPNELLRVVYVADDFPINAPPSNFHIPSLTLNPAHYEYKER